MSYNDENPVTNDGFPAGHGCRAPRHDGWTLDRQVGFLAELGAHGNVGRAADAVGMSASSAYRLRGRDEHGAFGHGWRAALAMAYYQYREIVRDRIENGVLTPVFYQGKIVGGKATFSDRLLIAMLEHLRPATLPGAQPAARAPAVDPAAAFGAALDAYAVAIENGTSPVVPVTAAAPAPAAAPAEPADAGPSPGEGPYHDARVVAAQGRLARGDDPHPTRFAGRIYAPHPDEFWLEAYPDGMTAEELAGEDPDELARVGLGRRPAETLSPA